MRKFYIIIFLLVHYTASAKLPELIEYCQIDTIKPIIEFQYKIAFKDSGLFSSTIKTNIVERLYVKKMEDGSQCLLNLNNGNKLYLHIDINEDVIKINLRDLFVEPANLGYNYHNAVYLYTYLAKNYTNLSITLGDIFGYTDEFTDDIMIKSKDRKITIPSLKTYIIKNFNEIVSKIKNDKGKDELIKDIISLPEYEILSNYNINKKNENIKENKTIQNTENPKNNKNYILKLKLKNFLPDKIAPYFLEEKLKQNIMEALNSTLFKKEKYYFNISIKYDEEDGILIDLYENNFIHQKSNLSANYSFGISYLLGRPVVSFVSYRLLLGYIGTWVITSIQQMKTQQGDEWFALMQKPKIFTCTLSKNNGDYLSFEAEYNRSEFYLKYPIIVQIKNNKYYIDFKGTSEALIQWLYPFNNIRDQITGKIDKNSEALYNFFEEKEYTH